MKIVSAILAAAIFLAEGCTSSPDGSVGMAAFVPQSRTPGVSQVFMLDESAEGQTVIVSVRVREQDGIAGSDLALEYDPLRLVYRGWLQGDLLEQGDASVVYNVFEEIPGRLRVRASRVSDGTASAGADDPILVLLQFKVVSKGNTSVTFNPSSALLDDQDAAIPGVTFFAGAFVGT